MWTHKFITSNETIMNIIYHMFVIWKIIYRLSYLLHTLELSFYFAEHNRQRHNIQTRKSKKFVSDTF